MPKDEFDFDDPLELNGVALSTDEDTSRDMAECFVEEFLMLHYNHKQILALFRNPHYLGMNMVLQNKGEEFVKQVIAETFARWGRPLSWGESPSAGALAPGFGGPGTAGSIPAPDRAWDDPRTVTADPERQFSPQSQDTPGSPPADPACELDEEVMDPLGQPVPKLNL